jgi:hypothetical protein
MKRSGLPAREIPTVRHPPGRDTGRRADPPSMRKYEMKTTLAACLSILIAAGASSARATEPSETAPAAPVAERQICVTPVTPTTTQYTVVKQLKVGKGSYGSVDEAITMLAAKARKAGADAVINYTGSQRFGFWPWRFVHPVVRGTAVKWASGPAFDCTASGGTLR